MTEAGLVLVGVWFAATIVLWAPTFAGHTSQYRPYTLLVTLLTGASIVVPSAPWSYMVLAVVAVVHAISARPTSSTASVFLVLSAAAAAVAAWGLSANNAVVAFTASSIAIALRVGLIPVHAGAAGLCERNAPLQSQQLATSVLLVVAHLRFMDHSAIAYDVAAMLVRIGAVFTVLPALMALVQRDLRGFFRSATVMHGGMVFAAMGAAGRGHMAAALMVTMTTAAAMTGLGMMVHALEERVGTVTLRGAGGRVHSFPRLAAAFVVFAGAGVAMPGTAGFIADDLLLHALWEESVWGTATVILGSAILAIAALATFARVFLGARQQSLAPDLMRNERIAAVVLLLLLIWLGITPGLMLTPADELLRASSPVYLL